MKNIILLISFNFLLPLVGKGQNRYINLGFKRNGFAIGNPKKYNGVKLSLWDKKIELFNGIQLSVHTKANVSNGLKIGLLSCMDSISNGLSLGGFAIIGTKMNGVAIAGIAAGSDLFNGLIVSPITFTSKKLNGLALGLLGIYSGKINGACVSVYFNKRGSEEENFTVNGFAFGIVGGADCHRLNGVSIGIGNKIDTLKGLSMGVINNTKVLHGVQIGLWNTAKNNRLFKHFPLININLRKPKKQI